MGKERVDHLIAKKIEVFDLSILEAFESVGLQFDITYTPTTHKTGFLHWDQTDATAELGLLNGVKITLGQEMNAYVVGNSVPIDNGTVVFIHDAESGRAKIKVASPDDVDVVGLIGVATQDIATGALGYITMFGLVRGFNTLALTAGTDVWLNAGGTLSETRPTSPDSQILIGKVIVSDAENGEIFVNPQRIQRLNELSDVHIPLVPSQGDSIAWSESGERYEAFSNATCVPWGFFSPAGASGEHYFGGFYQFVSGNNDFDPAISLGTANAAKCAHVAIITGAEAVDEVIVTVSGNSISDDGTLVIGDSEDIVVPAAQAASSYFETVKKFTGQVTIETISGTPIQCNYGFTKYWDYGNSDFRIVGFEVTWTGGANDANTDIELLHHKTTGWTYNAGLEPSPPTALARLEDTLGTASQIVNGEEGAFKMADKAWDVDGSASEGTLWRVTTTVNKSIEQGMIHQYIVAR